MTITTWTVPATVLRVIDGDTVVLDLDLGWHITLQSSARCIGINCPEMNTDAGKLAQARARELLPVGTRVTFVSHKLDKYGRVLGVILIPSPAGTYDVNYNKLMLNEGHAVPMEEW